jgi:hypothetical protein
VLIFAFGDDGGLTVYESAAEAIRDWEGIDVESGAVHFYDQQGTCLEPRFSKPNRRGKWLGLVGWVESGTYELIPNARSEQDPFALALFEVGFLNPNKWFSSLDQLKAAMSAQGVPVEYLTKQTWNGDTRDG